ncbi:hypothetical protein H310_05487 [Aphanomyces invadans]|uniref:Uncharacterized protein n=1 Tax=Aphanomyces invadans TaxID=157072 RepID=A0A024UBQ3_9STRA|nr:hypothetical protein H310_05487 [Aphanomyces invadans]ETW03058.1 hypothetical protein H310_05487 [Aphanomyces invadans]|eukprot:XP_008868442.1 hypothetical protein H310_05487 [Aphanomyces invadans]
MAPPPVFHVNTRHSARRQTAEKEAQKQNTEALASPSNQTTAECASDEHAAENVSDDSSPKLSARGDGENEGKCLPIRKASMNTTRFDRILGKYLVGDANLMCMEIAQQMSNNAESSTAMSGDTPPVAINWIEISASLLNKHQLHLKPRECQDLWKYLAYDQAPSTGMDTSASTAPSGQDEFASDSDVEDFNATAEFLANKRAKAQKAEPPSSVVTTNNALSESSASARATSSGLSSTAPSLFPSFDPPGFLKSDAASDLSNYAPLHTVAEHFLKRRRVDTGMPSPLPNQASVRAQLASSLATPPSKPNSSPPPRPPIGHSSVYMPRQPPPQPTPSLTDFDIFKRMYSDRSGLDDLRLRAIYEQSPMEVRTRCLILAAQDLERYQKECLRQKLYEKSVRRANTPPATPPRPVASSQATPNSPPSTSTSQPAPTTQLIPSTPSTALPLPVFSAQAAPNTPLATLPQPAVSAQLTVQSDIL